MLQAYVMRSFIFVRHFRILLLLIISWFLWISWISLYSLWGLTKPTYTPNLKSISQSRTEVWPNIGFKHILRSVGHLESDDLEKQVSFSFSGTYSFNLIHPGVHYLSQVKETVILKHFSKYSLILQILWIKIN